ncbi:amino acid permease [Candidatus Micrarchaeota archaeon]|nr:amino acid permease [Candidatus Micrarchaeota archaeon]
MPLKRELGLFSTTLYGTGVIIGAGIYALIGVGAGLAGNMLWAAFLISAAIAIFTGLSYAELSSMFPKEAAEYTYTRKAFKKEVLSFAVGWLLAIGTVIAASTVALGFAGYFSALFGGEPKLIAAGLILVMTALNYIGIKESAMFNNFSSVLEILGLLIVVAIGFVIASPMPVHADLFQMPATGFAGIMAAVSVIFFAYIGFENVANMAEEVKESRKIVPKALLLSLAISTVLYMLVAIASVSRVGWEALSQSKAPLMLVVSDALGPYAVVMSFIALFATANTALIFLIASSRMLYGMAHKGSLSPGFSLIGSRGTPYLSVLLVGLVAAAVSYATDIKTVAQMADLAVFMAYLAVNAVLIVLAGSKLKREFMSPRVFGIPVLAYLGVISAFIMLLHFELNMWLMEVVVLGVGATLFLMNKRSR